ncbi:MAG: TIGR00725 family protein [Candidatus Kariarchaeaceae archaeon]|jgi:uncharacterized protein (TIGR00725 family)
MIIGIIGSNESIATSEQRSFAFDVGKGLIDHGYCIINGGMGGIMSESAKGGRTSDRFEPHKVVAILPCDVDSGNPYSGVSIKTDLKSGRNRIIVLNSDALIAIGGGAGTLNEIAIAWEFGKPIAAYSVGKGWAGKLAGSKIDDRRDDRIHPVSSLDDLLAWLELIEID